MEDTGECLLDKRKKLGLIEKGTGTGWRLGEGRLFSLLSGGDG